MPPPPISIRDKCITTLESSLAILVSNKSVSTDSKTGRALVQAEQASALGLLQFQDGGGFIEKVSSPIMTPKQKFRPRPFPCQPFFLSSSNFDTETFFCYFSQNIDSRKMSFLLPRGRFRFLVSHSFDTWALYCCHH